jgi:3-phenylpropionate/trans-cinnamate dioxygenase ferredoxin subunit
VRTAAVAEHAVCRLDDLLPLVPRRFVLEGTPVCVVRIEDDLHAVHDTCSHAEVSLSEGEVDPETRDIECWKHGSCFSLVTGEPDTLPAYEPIPVFEIREQDGDVVVEV